MGAIVTSLLYITISLALTGLVGRALSRSGRAFLDQTFGGQGGAAEAASRLLVVAFYLLSLGFIALTLPSWAHVASTGRALQLLSWRLGVLLLVLGALHLTSTLIFARLRRGRADSIPYFAGPVTARTGRRSPDPRDAARYGAVADGTSQGETGAAMSGEHGTGEAAGGESATTPGTGSTTRPGAVLAPPAIWPSRPPRVVH